MKLNVSIPTPEHTARLARALAALWLEQRRRSVPGQAEAGLPWVLLLQGGLGAGKTTLTRFLVESLPGGERAEVSSPSFTLCNSYACELPVLHFDLYRLAPGQWDDDLAEALEMAENGDLLLIIEWPERISNSLLPAVFLHLNLLTETDGGRGAVFSACNDKRGPEALRRIAAEARAAGLRAEGLSA
ncbi:MAG: tRNA (adenosine(37)-N6)-threonylcarbamoyltransferase complex ATPase subunit type 1 TsaE [Deltaproteobacteria bacterium]|jgi:tRNA threonylcarbamoyladenosine biosynthesis protein TsaE|nr:tRNA (adenosine(37)-N6)-threonylcarbamoyltransferase complex ATPase subunit type 1 TsaE [Deltaproteobacteria bacterium]